MTAAQARRTYPSVSGLSPADQIVARNMACGAAALGLHNEPALHYTQGPARWEGIDRNLKAWRGQFPHFADCSAFVTWCIWNGLDHFHVRDTVNGLGWRAGYTGTMLEHGRRVTGQLMRADAVIYGTGWPGEHTAIYVGGGLVVSHGSEAGPRLEPVHLGMPILSIRRYI